MTPVVRDYLLGQPVRRVVGGELLWKHLSALVRICVVSLRVLQVAFTQENVIHIAQSPWVLDGIRLPGASSSQMYYFWSIRICFPA